MDLEWVQKLKEINAEKSWDLQNMDLLLEKQAEVEEFWVLDKVWKWILQLSLRDQGIRKMGVRQSMVLDIVNKYKNLRQKDDGVWTKCRFGYYNYFKEIEQEKMGVSTEINIFSAVKS